MMSLPRRKISVQPSQKSQYAMNGHVRQRGAGKWYAVIDARDSRTGNRKRKWVVLSGCTGKRQAQLACAKLIADLQFGGFSIEPAKTSLEEYLTRWLEDVKNRVSLRSHERYAEIVHKNIGPLLGSVKLARLQPAQISAAYSEALANGRRDGKGGLAPRSVHHIHRILKQALRQAVRWQLLARNPADAVDPPKVERKTLQTYDLPQTATLIEAMRPTRMFVPTLLGVLCGLRRGEIAALRWKNVNLDAGSLAVVESAEQTVAGIRYKEPKSGRSRKVSLSGTASKELKSWKLAQAQEFLKLGARPDADTFVVTQADGSPLQPRSITHEWVRLISLTKLPRIRFHDLRHAHATHLLGAGVHPKIASERLGHSKVGITLDLYSHVMPGMQEEAADRVDDALRAAMASNERSL
jgi:integrase